MVCYSGVTRSGKLVWHVKVLWCDYVGQMVSGDGEVLNTFTLSIYNNQPL